MQKCTYALECGYAARKCFTEVFSLLVKIFRYRVKFSDMFVHILAYILQYAIMHQCSLQVSNLYLRI